MIDSTEPFFGQVNECVCVSFLVSLYTLYACVQVSDFFLFFGKSVHFVSRWRPLPLLVTPFYLSTRGETAWLHAYFSSSTLFLQLWLYLTFDTNTIFISLNPKYLSTCELFFSFYFGFLACDWLPVCVSVCVNRS